MNSCLLKYINNQNKIYITHEDKFTKYIATCPDIKAPLKVEISLTNQCNQYCIHCSNSNRVNSRNHLYFKKQWLRNIVNSEPFIVILTGGEPFLNKDIFDIISVLKENNIIVRILTNGTFFGPTVIKKLNDSGFDKNDSIQISLDGINTKEYFSRRKTNHFETVISNIKLLSDSGYNVNVHSVPLNETINSISEVYHIADECGAYSFSTSTLAPIGNGINLNSIDVELLIKEELKILDKSCTYRTKYLGNLISGNCQYMHLIDFDCNHERYRGKEYICDAGNKRAYISENGDVYGCVYASSHPFSPLGNISKSSLMEIWKKTKSNQIGNTTTAIGGLCSSCEMWGLCTGGCIGVSSLLSGKVQIGYDTRCKIINNFVNEKGVQK